MDEIIVKITEAVHKSWESVAGGGIIIKSQQVPPPEDFILGDITPNEFLVVKIEPAIRELIGGKSDGKQIFPSFNFDIKEFLNIFDEVYSVNFHSGLTSENTPSGITFAGMISGNFFGIYIFSTPTLGSKSVEAFYTCGPKKGQVENFMVKDD